MAKEKIELWQYLASLKTKDRNYTYAEFADKVHVSRARLSRIVNYRDCPSYQLAKRIEEETGKKVSGWDLMEKCYNKSHGHRCLI